MRMQFLASLINDRKLTIGYELGVENGDTFRHILANCPSITQWHGVDMWGENPPGYQREYAGESYYKTVTNVASKHPDRAIIHRMSTDEACLSVEDESIDIVFIDADHSYEGVYNDILKWEPKVRKGGIISGHDYGLNPAGVNRFNGVDRAVHELLGQENIATGPDLVWWTEKV